MLGGPQDANAIFLVYIAPLYVALLRPWVLHEPIRRGDWLTLLLARLGLGCFYGFVVALLVMTSFGCHCDPRGSALHPAMRLGRSERYANASSRYPSAATASQRSRKAGWPPL